MNDFDRRHLAEKSTHERVKKMDFFAMGSNQWKINFHMDGFLT